MYASELMVDIETMGVEPGCAVLSIGAVVFDPYVVSTPQQLFDDGYYVNIALHGSLREGFFIDPDTEAWWEAQGSEAREALSENAIMPREAIRDFLLYCTNHKQKLSGVWANSPSFDCVILKKTTEMLGMRWPFPFYIWKDVRTLRYLCYPNGERPLFHPDMVAHHALHDAVNQALVVQHGYRELALSCNEHDRGQASRSSYDFLLHLD